MEKKVIEYRNRFLKKLAYWSSIMGSSITSEDIDEIDKYLPKYLNKIIENNSFILTDDYISYLCFYAFARKRYNTDYLSAFFSKLEHLSCSNDNEIEGALSSYYDFLLLDRELNDIKKLDGFYIFMNIKDYDLFSTSLRVRNKIWLLPGRPYEIKILFRMLIKIIYYCRKNNCYEKFDELINKYYSNPKETIEIFKIRGLIKESDIIPEFDSYIINNFSFDRGVISK